MHIKQHASWSKGGDPTFNPRAALLFRIEATIYSSGAYLRDQVGYSASTDCGPDRPLKIQLDQEGGVLQIAPRGNPQNNDIDFALSTTGENWKMSDKNHCKVGAFDPGRGYFPAVGLSSIFGLLVSLKGPTSTDSYNCIGSANGLYLQLPPLPVTEFSFLHC